MKKDGLKCFRKSTGPAAFLSATERKENTSGSLSLEAAVVLPLFLIAVLAFFSLFGVMSAQIVLQSGMESAGREAAALYYAREMIESHPENQPGLIQEIGEDLVLTALSETRIRQALTESVGTFADENFIVNGEDGISFTGTRYDPESKAVILCASCRVRCLLLPGTGFRVSQTSVHRAFTGKSYEGGTQEQIVYVTERGEVYHTSLSCHYLELSIVSADYQTIGEKRNASGGKYYECEICGGGYGDTVFITSYGDRYHWNKNCSGLKRTIKSIPISQTGNLPLCSKCRKRDGL